MQITQFYNTDYVDYANYSTLRQLGSAIDGLKNSSRKIICTVLDKNITNEIKVAQLNSKMAEYTEYLHGDASGVIVTLAQNFTGTNNLPLLDREGNFGTRFVPEASAPRYIYTNGSKELWNLFNKQDNNILNQQYFEGDKIEPVFYLPTLPLLLINGSFGTASGFKQDILSRNPESLKREVQNRLQGKKSRVNNFVPYFEGFNGTVEQGETSRQWLIKGTFKRISVTKVHVTEIPVGYTLKSYIKVLDKLEEDKVITTYKDKSDGDTFLFELSFLSATLKNLSDDQLMTKLKLIKKVSELYTCINEHNTVSVFDSAEEIFNYYYETKIKYLHKRKTHLLEQLENDIRLLFSKYEFIKNVVENNIKVNGAKKVEIIKDIKKFENIIKYDDSYDYLLRLPIYSLTEEKMKELLDKIKNNKKELDVLSNKSVETLWWEEL